MFYLQQLISICDKILHKSYWIIKTFIMDFKFLSLFLNCNSVKVHVSTSFFIEIIFAASKSLLNFFMLLLITI